MGGAAQARVFVGVGFGVPLFWPFVPPPVYYPPYYGSPGAYGPADNTFSYVPPTSYVPPSAGPQSLAPPRYYGPSNGYGPQSGYGPPSGYAPPMGGQGQDGWAQACHAGAYVCPLVADTPPGGNCSCPGNNGRRIRGQAG